MQTYSDFIEEARKRIGFTRLYHGTSPGDRASIERSAFSTGTKGQYGQGTYTSTNRNVARSYTRNTNSGEGKDAGVVRIRVPSKRLVKSEPLKREEGKATNYERVKAQVDDLRSKQRTTNPGRAGAGVMIKGAAKRYETNSKGRDTKKDYTLLDPVYASKHVVKTPQNKFHPNNPHQLRAINQRKRLGPEMDEYLRKDFKSKGPERKYVDRTKPRRSRSPIEEALRRSGKTIEFQRFYHGTTVPTADRFKKKVKGSLEGSIGAGHYLTPDSKKAKKYADFKGKERQQTPSVLAYRVPKKKVEKIDEIPKKLTRDQRVSGGKVIQNIRTGHAVIKPEDADRMMVRQSSTIRRPRRAKMK